MADDPARTFTLYEPTRAPNCLGEKWGRTWNESMGMLKEDIKAGLVNAAKAGMTSVAPVDALPLIGEHVKIRKGPGEADSSYRARLRTPFSTHSWSGTDKGVIDGYAPLGLSVRCKRNNQWDWDGHPGNVDGYWARMWVIIDPPNPFSPPITCGSGASSGGGALCGIVGATLEMIAFIRQVARDLSDASVEVVNEIIVFVAPLCGDGALCGGGASCGASAAYIEGW